MAFSVQGSVSGLLCQLDTPKHFVPHSVFVTHILTLKYKYRKEPQFFTGLQEVMPGSF